MRHAQSSERPPVRIAAPARIEQRCAALFDRLGPRMWISAAPEPVDVPAPACCYLFHHRVSRTRRLDWRWHQHDHWQFDMPLLGTVALRVEGQTFTLQPGHGLIIPFARQHGSRYLTERCDVLSIKFSWDNPWFDQPVLCDGGDTTVLAMIQALDKLLLSNPIDTHTISTLLGVVLRRQVPASTPPDVQVTGNAVLDRALVLIRDRNGRTSSVSQIAQTLQVSESCLHRHSRRALGHGLKQVIDDHRLLIAARLLCLGERTPAEVAAALTFRDLAELSRFVRQRTGVSPRALRRLHAEHITSRSRSAAHLLPQS